MHVLSGICVRVCTLARVRIHVYVCVGVFFMFVSVLCRVRPLRSIMSSDKMQRLVSAFVLSRFDYCNSVLEDLPAVTLNLL